MVSNWAHEFLPTEWVLDSKLTNMDGENTSDQWSKTQVFFLQQVSFYTTLEKEKHKNHLSSKQEDVKHTLRWCNQIDELWSWRNIANLWMISEIS